MIVDTGILFALMDRGDLHHTAAVELFRRREPRVVPEAVIVESDWLIERRLGVEPEIAFLRGLGEGSIVVEPSTVEDRRRAADVVSGYRDARIGYVDAIIVAIAERLGEARIATLDRRHLSMIRPRHVEAFEIVP